MFPSPLRGTFNIGSSKWFLEDLYALLFCSKSTLPPEVSIHFQYSLVAWHLEYIRTKSKWLIKFWFCWTNRLTETTNNPSPADIQGGHLSHSDDCVLLIINDKLSTNLTIKYELTITEVAVLHCSTHLLCRAPLFKFNASKSNNMLIIYPYFFQHPLS